jgi:glucose-1-phosphate thymidylyltransferase
MVSQAVLFAPVARYEPGEAPARASCAAASGLALLPVANKPLVLHAFDELTAAGIDTIAVVSESDVADEVSALVEQRAGPRRVTNHVVDGECGFIEALHHAAEDLSDNPFVVHLCDSLRRDGLKGWVSHVQMGSNDALAFVEPTEASVTPVGNGLSSLRAAGVYVFSYGVLELDEDDEPPLRWDSQIASACAQLAEAGGRTEVRPVRDSWRYRNRPDILLQANRFFLSGLEPTNSDAMLDRCELQGRVRIHPSARLRRSTVRGPVIIGPDAEVTDAYIGPYSSIGQGVVIQNAEVEHSVLLPGASIRNLGGRLESSVVGPEARIFRDFRLPRAFRLNVGKGAEVAIS